MKTQSALERGRKNLLLLLVAFGLFGQAGQLQAQSSFANSYDSITYYMNHKKHAYFGVELAMSTPQFRLQSNIPQINNLKAGFFGGDIGGVLANHLGKIKATMGSYTTNPSVPYTIEFLQGNVSASIYFLRIGKTKGHALEPYFSTGVSLQQLKFYGNYLPDNNLKNLSTTELPLLGEVGLSRLTVAAGLEYQLESEDSKFIHFFAEGGYGIPFQSGSSNSAFSQTKTSTSSWLSVGINFGISK